MAKPPCKVVVHGILLSRAVLLIEEESWIDSLPSVVLINKEISLFLIKFDCFFVFSILIVF